MLGVKMVPEAVRAMEEESPPGPDRDNTDQARLIALTTPDFQERLSLCPDPFVLLAVHGHPFHSMRTDSGSNG